MLAESFAAFLANSYDKVVYHRSSFPPGSVKSAKRVGVLLVCLSWLHASDLLKRVLPYQEPLASEIESLITVGRASRREAFLYSYSQRSANTFYTRAKRLVERDGHGDVDESYLGLGKLVNVINGACNAGAKIYHEPFDK